MIINCTKKLQDELKIKPEKLDVISPLFSWHSNIIRVNRRKTIVAMNDASGYTIVIHGVVVKDLKNIEVLILESIRTTLICDCVNPEIATKYIVDAGDIVFSKTQNRSLVAKMNNACEGADVFAELYAPDVKIQDSVAERVNKWNFIHEGKDYYHPYEMFYKLLEERYGAPVFRTKALVLNIKLDLANFDIWRKVIVPLNVSFYNLHNVIRNAYDWKDYHMHEFIIYHSGKPRFRIAIEADDFGMLPNNEEVYMEIETFVRDFLPKYKNIEYIYDFGDYWVHKIIIEDVLFDYDKNYPICIDGKGDRPPEDVGGEGGYEDFVRIMSDPNDAEYMHMKEWSESQNYEGFDIDKVNRRLKHML